MSHAMSKQERRLARQVAREKCAAERAQLKHWIPEERAGIARKIQQLRSQLRIDVATLRQKLAQDIRERRERTKARTCIDRVGGPVLRTVGPKKPPGFKKSIKTRTRGARWGAVGMLMEANAIPKPRAATKARAPKGRIKPRGGARKAAKKAAAPRPRKG